MPGLLTNAERSYHFNVRQFHRMMAAGIFEDQKVELVAGKIYAMTDLPPQPSPSGGFTRRCGPCFRKTGGPSGKKTLS